MESSSLHVERSREKFYGTKKSVENTLGEHMIKSKSLLYQICARKNIYNRDLVPKLQDHCIQSVYLSKRPTNASNNEKSTSAPLSPIPARVMSNEFNGNGDRRSPGIDAFRKITQAAWLIQTSNVSSNLSRMRNWEDDVKIPEILLTDPGDVLCGRKAVFANGQEEEKDTLSKLLNDTNYEKALEAEITNTGVNSKSLSYDVASMLDFDRCNNYKVNCNNKLVRGLIDDTCKGLDSLTHDLNSLVHAKPPTKAEENCDVSLMSENNCDINLKNMEEFYIKQFDSNSHLECSNKLSSSTYELTHALVHINERDKAKEAELAPKLCIHSFNEESRPTGPDANKSVQMKKITSNTQLSGTEGVESDPLSCLTIAREHAVETRIYQLSDFDRNMKKYSESQSTSVEVQTEDIEQPSTEVTDTSSPIHNYSVRVQYSDNSFGKTKGSCSNMLDNKKLRVEDVYAKKLLDFSSPKLEHKSTTLEGKGRSTERCLVHSNYSIQSKREEYYKQLMKEEQLEFEKWRLQRKKIYDRMTLNSRSGVRNYTLCRGGKKYSSSIVHSNYRDKQANQGTDTPNVEGGASFDSSAIDFVGYYGYDEDVPLQKDKEVSCKILGAMYDGNEAVTREETLDLIQMSSRGNIDKDTGYKPLENFENWWNGNTINPSYVRERFAI